MKLVPSGVTFWFPIPPISIPGHATAKQATHTFSTSDPMSPRVGSLLGDSEVQLGELVPRLGAGEVVVE